MTDPVQDQLIAARKAQILDAAAKVFAEKGYHPTTIKDIAHEAGIADGTIYNYFSSKNALLIGILERMRETIVGDADFDALGSGDIRTMLRAYVGHPLKTLRTDQLEMSRIVLSEVMVNAELRALYNATILTPTLTLAEMLFEDWASKGLISAANIPLAVRTISAMVLGLTVTSILGDPVLDAQWDALPDFLADVLLGGIGSKSA